MNMTHTKKHESTSTAGAVKSASVSEFWSKEPVFNIANFCSATRYALDIISPTEFRLVKE